jgi:hypothetical protein
MNSGRTVFAQLIEFLPKHVFRKCVARYQGDYRCRKFSCRDQLLCMAFAQITYRESLRDIESCLRASRSKLFGLGLRGKVSRSTLADANELRDHRIYEDFAIHLMTTAQELYSGESWGRNLKRSVYALDATTIDLCLSLFPWAKFRKRKGAIKVHALIDVVTRIPTVIRVTPGSIHEVHVLDELFTEPGAIYLMDRGYTDFKRLQRLHASGAFFVIRAKKNARFKHSESRPVDKQKGFRCDQTVHLVSPGPAAAYREGLRRVSFFDSEKQKRLVFLTNNFQWTAATIAALYKSRWRVELFFKWIKQNLRIKSFYGTTENAVKTQIWIAVTVYLLAAIVKKTMNLSQPLASILQILSVTPFEKIPLQELLCEIDMSNSANESCKQLTLFDF